ncbi:MAG: response regulator [Treponema sp.]|jgi:two-component system response regulator YesN|nr:response regulator [Treponema sp.]
MKVAVLDDEEKVCTLICTLIEWKKLGLVLTGTASDGISGLELIKSTKPDLLITDIRMPGMTGLELVKAAKEVSPDLQVIIISGYSQFDYAQTAINYGVVNYLLKPIKKQELNTVLKKMTDTFQLRCAETEKSKRLEEIVERRQKQDAERLLITAVTCKTKTAITDFPIPFPLRLSAIKVDSLSADYDENAIKILIRKFEEKMEQIISDQYITAFNTEYTFILAVHEKNEGNTYLNEILSWCKSQTQVFTNFTMTIATAEKVLSRKDLYGKARFIFQGLSRRLEDGGLAIYEEKTLLPETGFDYDHNIKVFFNAILQEAVCSFDECFGIFKKNIEDRDLAPYQYEMIIREFTLRFLEEASLHLSDINYQQLKSDYDKILLCASKKQLWETVYNYLKEAFDLFADEEREKYSKPIRLAKQYIAENYDDSMICLNTVAEKIDLNSAYFSVLFKKSCGIGFSEYLQNLRMGKAKELLVQTRLPIKQIAAFSGYSDPKHFAKVFKNINGIKPIEYRKLYE